MKRGYEVFADSAIDFGTSIIATIKTELNQQYKKLKESPNITEECIENQEVVIKARQKIHMLRCSILSDYQGRIFDGIRILIEREWRKQQYEATDM